MSELPKMPVASILGRRDRLFANVLAPLSGQEVGLDPLVTSLRRNLPSTVSKDTLFESVRYLAGTTLNRNAAWLLAWRIAGNIDRLKDGTPVTPWSSQTVDEWVPLQIIRHQMVRDRYDHLTNLFTFRVLAGTPVGLSISNQWSNRLAKFVASFVGFSKSYHDYPYHHASQLVGLRVAGFIEVAKSHNEPVFKETKCPSGMYSWNRENVLRLRLRVSGQECPEGFRHTCHNCFIGYDECPAATHKMTYYTDFCSSCNINDVLFDPEDHSTHCIKCTRTERTRKKT